MKSLSVIHPLIALVLVFVAACSSKDPNEPKEVVPKDVELLTSDAPENVLLDTAQTLYMNGLYSVARDSFQSLYSTYPLGAYVEYAKVKAADCSFLLAEYESAAADYENFLKDHPGHSARDYATYRAGLSHYFNNKGVGRDIAPLEQAIKFFEKTQQEYPDSAFAKSADYYHKQAEKKLAAYNQEVLEFYQDRGNTAAYANRKEEFDTRWAAVAESKVKWPKQSDNVVMADLGPVPAKGSSFSLDGVDNPNSIYARAAMKTIPESVPGNFRFEAIKCRTSKLPGITLFFDNETATTEKLEAFAAANEQLNPRSGKISVKIDGMGGDIRSYNCLAQNDIQFDNNGVIQITTDRSWQIMQVANPNRLILLPTEETEQS